MLRVELNPGLAGGRWLYLRPLCGHDEAGIDARYPFSATELLDQLLVEVPGTAVGPGKAWEMSITDRDRALAALYQKYYGNRVEAVIRCTACSENFEVSFSVDDMLKQLDTVIPAQVEGPDREGLFVLNGGTRLRLPTSTDVRFAITKCPESAEQALLERCVTSHDAVGAIEDIEILQSVMEQIGPVLDFEFDEACPDCETVRRIRFDLPAYLMTALAQEKAYLIHEVHRIATAYGWSLTEILGLTRDDRRAYVALIGADTAARRRHGL